METTSRSSIGVHKDCTALRKGVKGKLCEAQNNFRFHKPKGHRAVIGKHGVKTVDTSKDMWHNGKEVLPWMKKYFTGIGLYSLPPQWSTTTGVVQNVWMGFDGASRKHSERIYTFNSLRSLQSAVSAEESCRGYSSRPMRLPTDLPSVPNTTRHPIIKPLHNRLLTDQSALPRPSATISANKKMPHRILATSRPLADITNSKKKKVLSREEIDEIRQQKIEQYRQKVRARLLEEQQFQPNAPFRVSPVKINNKIHNVDDSDSEESSNDVETQLEKIRLQKETIARERREQNLIRQQQALLAEKKLLDEREAREQQRKQSEADDLLKQEQDQNRRREEKREREEDLKALELEIQGVKEAIDNKTNDLQDYLEYDSESESSHNEELDEKQRTIDARRKLLDGRRLEIQKLESDVSASEDELEGRVGRYRILKKDAKLKKKSNTHKQQQLQNDGTSIEDQLKFEKEKILNKRSDLQRRFEEAELQITEIEKESSKHAADVESEKKRCVQRMVLENNEIDNLKTIVEEKFDEEEKRLREAIRKLQKESNDLEDAERALSREFATEEKEVERLEATRDRLENKRADALAEEDSHNRLCEQREQQLNDGRSRIEQEQITLEERKAAISQKVQSSTNELNTAADRSKRALGLRKTDFLKRDNILRTRSNAINDRLSEMRMQLSTTRGNTQQELLQLNDEFTFMEEEIEQIKLSEDKISQLIQSARLETEASAHEIQLATAENSQLAEEEKIAEKQFKAEQLAEEKRLKEEKEALKKKRSAAKKEAAALAKEKKQRENEVKKAIKKKQEKEKKIKSILNGLITEEERPIPSTPVRGDKVKTISMSKFELPESPKNTEFSRSTNSTAHLDDIIMSVRKSNAERRSNRRSNRHSTNIEDLDGISITSPIGDELSIKPRKRISAVREPVLDDSTVGTPSTIRPIKQLKVVEGKQMDHLVIDDDDDAMTCTSNFSSILSEPVKIVKSKSDKVSSKYRQPSVAASEGGISACSTILPGHLDEVTGLQQQFLIDDTASCVTTATGAGTVVDCLPAPAREQPKKHQPLVLALAHEDAESTVSTVSKHPAKKVSKKKSSKKTKKIEQKDNIEEENKSMKRSKPDPPTEVDVNSGETRESIPSNGSGSVTDEAPLAEVEAKQAEHLKDDDVKLVGRDSLPGKEAVVLPSPQREVSKKSDNKKRFSKISLTPEEDRTKRPRDTTPDVEMKRTKPDVSDVTTPARTQNKNSRLSRKHGPTSPSRRKSVRFNKDVSLIKINISQPNDPNSTPVTKRRSVGRKSNEGKQSSGRMSTATDTSEVAV